MATSFSLAYEMEVVLLIEIEMAITRTIVQETRDNNANVKRHLDWSKEEQKATTIWIASYHQRTIAQYNKRARERLFQQGDLVSRQLFENIVEIETNKLQGIWEGPYVVTKMGELGAYHLQTIDET